MIHLRPQRQSGGRHRRGGGPSTFRTSTLSTTATIWTALLVFCCADADGGSARAASPVTLSRLMAAAARARDPASEGRLRWELARVLRDAGRHDEAIVEYRKALVLDGTLGEARRELAQLLRARGRPSEAAEEYQVVLRRHPADTVLRRELAETWVEAKQDGRAIAELERLGADLPSDLSARRRVIELYEMRGRWTDVITSAQALLATTPDDPQVRLHLARALIASQRAAEAVSHLKQLVRMEPGHHEGTRLLADALSWQGKHQEAIGLFREVLLANPADRAARIGLARALSWSERHGEAIAEYDRVLELDPRDPLVQRERARVLGWAQRFAEAREGYDRALRDVASAPEEPQGRLLEEIRLERDAKQALWIGRYTTAADLYERLLSIERRNQEARFDRAQALSQLGLWRSAELAYLELLALDPFHRQAAIARERAAVEQGPRGEVRYEFFESRGRGTLADIRRQKVSTSAGLPLAADWAVLTAEYAHTFFPIGDFELNAYTIRLDGRLGHHLTGSLRATHNDYLAPLRSKQNYDARLDYRLLDRATLTLNYRREDVHENRESLSQQIQRDIVTVKGEMPLSVRDAVGAAYSYARYSDDNERQAFELSGSHQFSLYPRILKLTYTLSYQDFSRGTIFPPDGSSIPTVHPYFAPPNFFTNAFTLEWRHYLQQELFLGANQCYYDFQWTPAIESIDAVFSNTVRGEVLCDLTRRFTVSVQGLISRSTTYEAEQLSLQLVYRF